MAARPTVTQASLAGLAKFKKAPPPKARIIDVKADTLLLAFMAFKQPYKIRMAYMIPKDRAAWLEYLLWLVKLKKKTTVKYLNDKELKKVIERARPNLAKKYPPIVKDPDLPDSVDWTEEQVADWVEEIGYPNLKNAFRENFINGRKLVHVDASALCKMGIQDFQLIKNLATRIREVLQSHRPNMLRAIARRVPYEMFLKLHSRSGPTYDGLTFQKFCEENGFPYPIIRRNKSALIPCVVPVQIAPPREGSESSESEAESDDLSLEGAPSVEYIVRHQIVRNRAIQRIIDEVLSRIFDPNRRPTRGEGIDKMIRRILDEALLELGFGDPNLYTQERLEFASGVAEKLLNDLGHTAEVLNDIKKFEEHLKNDMDMGNIKPDDIQYMHKVAKEFVEDVGPISIMLALDQYSLESIFKEQPEFQEYIEGVVADAETKANEWVPTAEELVHDILSEAKLEVMAQDEFPYLSLDQVRDAKHVAESIIDELLENTVNMAHENLVLT